MLDASLGSVPNKVSSSPTHNRDVVVQRDEDRFRGSLPPHDSGSRLPENMLTRQDIQPLNLTRAERPTGPSERRSVPTNRLNPRGLASCLCLCLCLCPYLFSRLDNNCSETTESRQLHCEAILTHRRHVDRLTLLR